MVEWAISRKKLRYFLSFCRSLDRRHILAARSLDHNLEAEDHLRIVPASGGADAGVLRQGEPPSQSRRQVLLATRELCSHRGARAVSERVVVKMFLNCKVFPDLV